MYGLQNIFNLKILLFAMLCFCLYAIISNYMEVSRWHKKQFLIDSEESKTSYVVYTEGCRIPDFDALDKSICHCVYNEKPIKCDKDGLGMLVKSFNKTLYVDKALLSNYELTEETVNCCYKKFWIEYPRKGNISSIIRYSDNCIRFTEVTIEDEFVHVECSLPKNKTYEDKFIFVKERGKNISRDDDKLTVLIVGLDSVSRLNFHRQMPKTVKFLEILNAVEMFGFNKIGLNTNPNVLALTTGLPKKELTKICLPNETTGTDECPMIWKLYKNNGFITGLGEDTGWKRESIFRCKKQPTDFYYNILPIAAYPKMFHKRHVNYEVCLRKRLVIEVFLDAVKQFAIRMKDIPKFGFFWSSTLSHDFLNLLEYADDYYYKFLKDLYDNDVFNRSIVILMSDHGIRFGCIRATYQGYMEESLPALYFKYPTWFPDKYPNAVKNLKINAHRLISPYDVHETLVDLIDLNSISNSALDNRISNSQLKRGISLFLPMNESRTCDDAEIPKVYCTCHEQVPLETNNEEVKHSAKTIVNYVNDLLRTYRQCSSLYVIRIMSARAERSVTDTVKKTSYFIGDYTVTFEAGPSLAHLEGTVRYTPLTNSYQVIPPINRINVYRNQSFCIENALLKHYCYCINNLTRAE